MNYENISLLLKIPTKSNNMKTAVTTASGNLGFAIIKILKDGGVLLLDELETTLYPIIGEKILSLFLNRKINSKGAQIIFSTQDINLLNFNILRKDQIWFLERTRETEFMSTLYSLGSIKGIRKDENIRKNYINGKYSRVPSFSNNSLESFFY